MRASPALLRVAGWPSFTMSARPQKVRSWAREVVHVAFLVARAGPEGDAVAEGQVDVRPIARAEREPGRHRHVAARGHAHARSGGREVRGQRVGSRLGRLRAVRHARRARSGRPWWSVPVWPPIEMPTLGKAHELGRRRRRRSRSRRRRGSRSRASPAAWAWRSGRRRAMSGPPPHAGGAERPAGGVRALESASGRVRLAQDLLPKSATALYSRIPPDPGAARLLQKEKHG